MWAGYKSLFSLALRRRWKGGRHVPFCEEERGIRFYVRIRTSLLQVTAQFVRKNEAQPGLCEGLEQPRLLPGLAPKSDLCHRAKSVAYACLLLRRKRTANQTPSIARSFLS